MSYVPNPRPTGDLRASYREDNRLFQTAFESRFAIFAVLALIVAAPFMSTVMQSQLLMIGIFSIAAIGLNLLVGISGQISLGHGAFFGFGAFASAWLVNSWGIPACYLGITIYS